MKKREYQPKTGARCHCKRGVQRSNCPDCEGTGWRIDFAAIRKRKPIVRVEGDVNQKFADAMLREFAKRFLKAGG